MGALLTDSTFLVRFPEFGEQQVSVINLLIDKAERDTPADPWDDVGIRTDAVGYLTAHLLALRITQIGLQVGSPSGPPTGMGYDSTLYGQEYKRMRDCLPVCGFAYSDSSSIFY
jgi:hypothetical protein